MSEPTDGQLIDAYRTTGDMPALNLLVDRHLDFVRCLILGLVLNPVETDDLTQEVFVKAIHALPQFRQRSAFRTWLYRIAVNIVHDHGRRPKFGVSGEMMPEVSDPAPSPADMAVLNEMNGQLGEAIKRLSPCLRRAFLLVGVQGLGARQAAEMEGCLTATMYRRIHMARRQLAKWLQGDLLR